MFYGVYEKEGGEAQLRGEVATPTLQGKVDRFREAVNRLQTLLYLYVA